MFNSKKISNFLVPGRRVHLVGIGGVSMRPLGLVLKGMGMLVTGSDMNASVSTDELISKGIDVTIGHRAENINGDKAAQATEKCKSYVQLMKWCAQATKLSVRTNADTPADAKYSALADEKG